MEAETGALLARQALPPDEVVSWTISARQKSQWERFFLYLDLESLLRKNPEKDRSFRNATEAARRQMVDQFRQQLRRPDDQAGHQRDPQLLPGPEDELRCGGSDGLGAGEVQVSGLHGAQGVHVPLEEERPVLDNLRLRDQKSGYRINEDDPRGGW